MHAFNVRAYDKVGNVSIVSTFGFTVTKPNSATLFAGAKTVLNNRCTSCHSPNGGEVSFALATEAEFVSKGFVTPGNIATSKIIYRLKNYTTGNSRTMPLGGTLTAQEYNALVNWVSGMPR